MGVVLVLGAAGLLGHRLVARLAEWGFGVVGTVRAHHDRSVWQALAHFGRMEVIDDVRDVHALRVLMTETRAEAVVNCVATPARTGLSVVQQTETNALFPHRLASEVCDPAGARLLHVSTDAVFNGTSGPYREDSTVGPSTIYGCTKFLGEISYGRHVTVRTSLYGREVVSRRGLVEWLLSARGQISGYRHVLFSGVTADTMARFAAERLLCGEVSGLIHLGAAPISKYDLLRLLAAEFRLPVEIAPLDVPVGDWSLHSIRTDVAAFRVPDHEQMVAELGRTSREPAFSYVWPPTV
ncbi:MAG: sugar nucleotide-binding protein [Chloroflexota bacterium]